MPENIREQTKDLAKGADVVAANLDKIADSAGDADKVIAKLAQRMSVAAAIAKKFVKTESDIVAGLANTVAKTNFASKGMMAIGKATSASASSFLKFSTSLKQFTTTTTNAFKGVTSLNKGLKEIQTKKLVTTPDKDFKRFGVTLKQAADRFKEYFNIAKKTGNIKIKPVTFTSKAGAAEAKELAKNIATVSARASVATKIFASLNDSLEEGSWEAKRFASGIGNANGVLLGAGVASVFLARKIGDLLSTYEESRMSLSRYRIATDMAKKTTMGFSGSALESLKKNLNLTRSQASMFFDVVKEGTNVLGMSPAKILTVAKALQNTFGGDPTSRLKEYIDLLKQIPTLETDLKVSASMDDKTAALFDLATSGQMESVIELQQAGLIGGRPATKEASGEVGMLNAQQKTMAATEKINDTLLNFFPKMGSQLAAIADYGLKAWQSLGWVAGTTGALGVFLGGRVAAGAAMTTAAVNGGSAAIVAALEGQTLMRGGASLVGRGMGAGGKALAGLGGAKAGQSGLKYMGSLMSRGAKGEIVTGKAIAPPIRLPSVGPARVPPAGESIRGLGSAIGSKAGSLGGAIKGNLSKVGFGIAPKLMASLSASMARSAVSLTKFTQGLNVAQGSVRAFSKLPKGSIATTAAMLTVGLAAEHMAKKMESSGDKTKAATTRMAVATAGATLTIASLASTGAALGSFIFPGLGTVIGGVIGSAAGLALSLGSVMGASESLGRAMGGIEPTGAAYKKTLEEAKSSAVEFYGSMDGARKAISLYDKAIEASQNKTVQSGLAFQQQWTELENAISTGKNKLIEFQEKVSGIDIRALQTLGGSSEAFASALDTSAKIASVKFKMISKTLDVARLKLMNNSKMETGMRRQLLLRVHEVEINAAMELARGLSDVVDAMLKTPKIIELGMKQRMTSATTGPAMGQGAMSSSAGIKSIGEQIDANTAEQEEQAKAYASLISERQRIEADLDAKATRSKENLANIIKTLDQKQLDDLSKIGALQKGASGYEIGANAAEAIKKLKEQLDGLALESDKLSGGLDGKSILRMADEYKQANASVLAEKRKEIEAKESEAVKAATGGTFSKGDESEATALRNRAKELQAEYEMIAQSGRDSITKADEYLREMGIQGIRAEQIPAIFEAMNGSAEEAIKALTGLVDCKLIELDVGNKLKDFATKNKDNLDKRNVIEKKSLVLSQQLEVASAGFIAPSTLLAENYAQATKIAEDLQGTAEKGYRLRQSITTTEWDEVTAAERKVTALKAEQTAAEAAGDPASAVVAVMEAQRDVWKRTKSASEAELAYLEARLATDENLAKTLKEASDAKEAELKSATDAKKDTTQLAIEAKTLAGKMNNAAAQLKVTKDGIVSAKNKAAEAARSLVGLFDPFDQILAAIENTPAAQIRAALTQYGEALQDQASISGNFASTSAKATALLVKAAREQYQEEISPEKINNAMKTTRDVYRQQTAAETDPAKKAKREAEEESVMEAEKGKFLAIAEYKLKTNVVAYAKRESEIANNRIAMEQNAVEDQIQYLNDIGGSFGTIMEMTAKSVSYEQEKLAILQQQYETVKQTDKDGLESRNLELQIERQKRDIARKSMGAQKSAMEKLLGMAMGELRSSPGARRQYGTDVSMLGVDATRVKTASGMYAQAEKGDVKSINLRALDLQNKSAESARQGQAVKLSPEQLEAKQSQFVKDTADNTKEAVGYLKTMASGITIKGGIAGTVGAVSGATTSQASGGFSSGTVDNGQDDSLYEKRIKKIEYRNVLQSNLEHNKKQMSNLKASEKSLGKDQGRTDTMAIIAAAMKAQISELAENTAATKDLTRSQDKSTNRAKNELKNPNRFAETKGVAGKIGALGSGIGSKSFAPSEGSMGIQEKLPQYAKGGRVEKTGLALVHEGEMIVPAALSQSSAVSSVSASPGRESSAGMGIGATGANFTCSPITGEVTVSVVFDDEMFRARVQKLAVESLVTPEGQKFMGQSGAMMYRPGTGIS